MHSTSEWRCTVAAALLLLLLCTCPTFASSSVLNSTRRSYELQQSRLIKEYVTPSVEMRPPPPPVQKVQMKHPPRQHNEVHTVQGHQPPVPIMQQQPLHQPASTNTLPRYEVLNNYQLKPDGGYEQWRGLQPQQQQPHPAALQQPAPQTQQQQQPQPSSQPQQQMQFHSTSPLLHQQSPSEDKEIHFLIHRPADYNLIKQTLQEDAALNNQNIEFLQGPTLKLKQEQKLYLPPKKKTIVYVMMAEPQVDLNVEVMENNDKEPEPEVYVVYQKPGDKHVMHHGHTPEGKDIYQGQASNVNVVYGNSKKADFGAKKSTVPICRSGPATEK